jgi:hypothetical protein
MGSTRRSKRKPRQTQLTFLALPSSSPASVKVAKDFGERSYAAVGYVGSPAKRRKIKDEESNGTARKSEISIKFVLSFVEECGI